MNESHFLRESATYLEDGYLPRIRRALDVLPDGDLWWRPNPESNSVGNLLHHMAGNLRQWVVSGVGGEPDRRQRQAEFDADGSPGGEATTVDAAFGVLQAAVTDAVAVLRALDPSRLDEPIVVQGRDTTVMAAVYHAVEHFAMHTGQILWIAKARAGRDLGLYRTGPDGHPWRAW
jgi:uncharacterized damage-inducible protein DinB